MKAEDFLEAESRFVESSLRQQFEAAAQEVRELRELLGRLKDAWENADYYANMTPWQEEKWLYEQLDKALK